MLCSRIKELVSMLAILCRFLYEHKSALGALAGMTAGQLGWAGRTVVSVTPDTCAMVALSLMRDHEVAGIGVVSQSGALIGNFSYSDLRSADACLTHHDRLMLELLQGSSAGIDCTLVSSALGGRLRGSLEACAALGQQRPLIATSLPSALLRDCTR